jgi:hypothetical protein
MDPFPTLPEKGELEWEKVVDRLREYLVRNNRENELTPILEKIGELEGGRIENVRHSAQQLYSYFRSGSGEFHYIPFPTKEKGRLGLERDVAELRRELESMKQKASLLEMREKELERERKEKSDLQDTLDAIYFEMDEDVAKYRELKEKYDKLVEERNKKNLIPIPKESSDLKALTIANANYENENKRLREQVEDYRIRVGEIEKLQKQVSDERAETKRLRKIVEERGEEIKKLEEDARTIIEDAEKGYEEIAESIAQAENDTERTKIINNELKKRLLVIEVLEKEGTELKKERDDLLSNNIHIMQILSGLQEKHGASFSDDENTKMEESTKNIVRSYDSIKGLVEDVRKRLHSYDESPVIGGGIARDYDVSDLVFYHKAESERLDSLVGEYNHMEVVHFVGNRFIPQGTLSSISSREGYYAVDSGSVLSVNSLATTATTTTNPKIMVTSRPWDIGDHMLKYAQGQRNHNGIGTLELMFRDGEGRRMLHLEVSNISSQTVDLGKTMKHISYKFINVIGRDVISRSGSLSLKYKESGRLVVNKFSLYTISLPPFSDKESHGIEMVTDLTGDIKLYTTHLSFNLVTIEMLTFPHSSS